MFCGECGAQNPDTNQFCRNCGKPLARRQPAPGPAAAPPAGQAPPPAIPYQQPAGPVAAAPVQAPAATPGRRWNWLGIASLIPGFLSWFIFTGILAVGAILLGIAGIVLFWRSTGRIGISSVVGIILGVTAIAVKAILP